MYKIKRYFRKTRNLIKWIPILWQDEQWDESFLWEILKFKFKLMETHFNSDDCWATDFKKMAFQCKVCKLLCERLINDVYWDLQDINRWANFSAAKQDIDLLTKLIKKHSLSWWD